MRKEITLDTGAVVTVSPQFNYSKCKGCPKNDIVWAITRTGKNIPIRWDKITRKWICHFADCPAAKRFRKDKK